MTHDHDNEDVNSLRRLMIEATITLMRRFATTAHMEHHFALYALSAAKTIVGLSVLPVVDLEYARARHLTTRDDVPVQTAVGLCVRRMDWLMHSGIEMSGAPQWQVVTDTLHEAVVRVVRYRRNPARFKGRARPTDFASSLVRWARRRLFEGGWACPAIAAELSAMARDYGGAV